MLSRFTHTLPADLAAEMSASEALLLGAGGDFLADLAGAAIEEPDDEAADEAGAALAAGAGVAAGLGAGAGLVAGAAMEFPAGAAMVESDFLLLFEDFLLAVVSPAGAVAVLDEFVSAFELFFDFLAEVVSVAGAAALDASVSAFPFFLEDFLLEVLVEP